jgi:uncharacterized membrane protein
MLCCFGSMFKRHDNRIDIIDALRGVSILLMVVYHFGYDMVMYGRWPDWILFNPAINTLQSVFAGVFILLCGFSCRYSRNNPRRGIFGGHADLFRNTAFSGRFGFDILGGAEIFFARHSVYMDKPAYTFRRGFIPDKFKPFC